MEAGRFCTGGKSRFLRGEIESVILKLNEGVQTADWVTQYDCHCNKNMLFMIMSLDMERLFSLLCMFVMKIRI